MKAPTALLCGPDMPTVVVVDFESTGAVELTLDAVEPLRTYLVGLRGRGQAYDDPAALLRREDGRPVEVTMELTWSTVGTPYQYRITPRYEIPCTVSGSVTVDDHTYSVTDVPGQRDHSWGVRDWWSMDWVWSALHLDDGTHLHGVDIRIPGAPPIGIGMPSGRVSRWWSCRPSPRGRRSGTTVYRSRQRCSSIPSTSPPLSISRAMRRSC